MNIRKRGGSFKSILISKPDSTGHILLERFIIFLFYFSVNRLFDYFTLNRFNKFIGIFKSNFIDTFTDILHYKFNPWPYFYIPVFSPGISAGGFTFDHPPG